MRRTAPLLRRMGIVLGLCGFCCGTAAAAGDAEGRCALTRDGKPLAVVVLVAGHGPQEKLAAEELVEHVEKISGARLPVLVVPGAGHFFHGQLPLLKSLVTRHLQS